ncbi:MAG: ammonium transporter, Amt family [Actinomycetota bacterium]|nr:ammonium transporter, Amt family [Actinomycetota bacterium]
MSPLDKEGPLLTEIATALHLAANTCTPTSPPAACQPSWLDTGSNSWQLTAATFVGLMSVPGLALLYGGLVPRKWVVNTMFMAFSGFSVILVVWVLWAYKMGFGSPIGGGTANTYTYKYGGNFFKNFFNNFVGHPETSLRGTSETSQASLPIGTAVPLSQATTALFYFQFVFAAITPLLFLGSVIGRIKIKVWIVFVPLWTTFVYAVNAMLLWGGGYWSHEGAVDYSGGYVIHLAAGTSGFVAAWVIGPRLARDRQRFLPHSLPLVSIGAGIVWLGWNGFNGGDPYFASADAATAVVNTNLATVSALLTWVLWDMFLSKGKKPTLLGAVNGMIVGLVAITPGAGFVNGLGALLEGVIASTIVWFAWTYLQPILIKRVDDAMGVFYTHGIAGLCGGLLVGIFADPSVVVYPYTTGGSPFAVKGWLYGNRHEFTLQILAALTIIVWDALVTFIILKVISIFTPLRMSDEELEIGDLAVHGEEAYPSDEGFARV